MTYFERSNKAYLKAYGRFDVTFDYGQGVYLYDVTGKKYLDFYSGIGVNSFGTNYQPYIQKMQKQMEKLMHVSNYFNTVEGVEGAEAVLRVTQMDRVFFTNSGTEATEGALKLARKYYYQKHGIANSEIISLKHSFHGRSTGSLKLTGNPNYQEAFEPLIDDVKYGTINDLASVKNLISPRTCGIILEPVQGEGGVNVCTPEFIKGIRKLCDQHDICMIIDEVQSGMGRTGTYMTYFQYNILPDVVCMAKGIGAGFPMGAFAARGKYAEVFEPGDHGSTYGGNPLATKAAKTVIDILEETKMLEHVQEVSDYLFDQLNQLKDKYDFIKDVRGKGLMIGVELAFPAKPVISRCIDQGLIVITAGTNVIRILPPFIITEKDVDEMIKILDQVLKEFV